MTLAIQIFIGWLIFTTLGYIGHLYRYKFKLDVCFWYIMNIFASTALYIDHINPGSIWFSVCMGLSLVFCIAAIVVWLRSNKSQQAGSLVSRQSRQSSIRPKNKRRGPQRGGSRGFWG